jgi:PAS domain S-box-containing protein
MKKAADLQTPLVTGSGLDIRDTDDVERQRVSAIVDFSRRLTSEPDAGELSFDAARLAGELTAADCYAITGPCGDEKSVACHLGRLDQPASGAVGCQVSTNDSESASGYVLHTQQSALIRDYASESRFRDSLFEKESLRSGVVAPLLVHDRCFGTLAVYAATADRFHESDVDCVENLANLVTLALARQAAERRVLEQQQRLDALVDNEFVCTMELDSDFKIQKLNSALQQLTGFSPQDLCSRSVFSAFILPEEMQHVHEALRTTKSTGEAGRLESFLLTKGGERKRIVWSFSRVPNDTGESQTVLGVGTDVTELHCAAEQVQRARAAADNAIESLRSLQRSGTRKSGKSFDASREERRQKKRFPFPYKQSLAPLVDDQMPVATAFREVRCHNLSRDGFSFWSEEIPDYNGLLVTFGNGSSMIYVTAQVIHVTPFDDADRELFLVGCRYQGRLDLDTWCAAPEPLTS